MHSSYFQESESRDAPTYAPGPYCESGHRVTPTRYRLKRTRLPSSGSGSAAVGSMAEPTPPTLPSELPVLPLRRTVAFPLTLQPLSVNQPVSIETVNRP